MDAVPDSKIWKKRHHEISHLVDEREKSAYSSSGNSGEIVVKVVIGGRHCSCALSEDGDLSWFVISVMAEDDDPWTYLAGISTKRRDVLLHPLQSNTLVMQAKVERTSPHRLRSLRKAERPKTIVDGHVQNRCPLCVTSINKRVNDLWVCDGVRTRFTDCPTRKVPS